MTISRRTNTAANAIKTYNNTRLIFMWHPVSSDLSLQSFTPLQTLDLSMQLPSEHSNFPGHVLLVGCLWHPFSSDPSGQSFCPLQTRFLSTQLPFKHSNCPGHVPFRIWQSISSEWSLQSFSPLHTRFLSIHSPLRHSKSPLQSVIFCRSEIVTSKILDINFPCALYTYTWKTDKKLQELAELHLNYWRSWRYT